MLPWQKKRREEAEAKLAAAKKEMESVNTSVIDDKGQNEEIVKKAFEPEKQETPTPEIQLDPVEIGILNNHRAKLSIQMQMLEIMQNIEKELKELNKKS